MSKSVESCWLAAPAKVWFPDGLRTGLAQSSLPSGQTGRRASSPSPYLQQHFSPQIQIQASGLTRNRPAADSRRWKIPVSTGIGEPCWEQPLCRFLWTVLCVCTSFTEQRDACCRETAGGGLFRLDLPAKLPSPRGDFIFPLEFEDALAGRSTCPRGEPASCQPAGFECSGTYVALSVGAVTVPRDEGLEVLPGGWVAHYTTSSVPFRSSPEAPSISNASLLSDPSHHEQPSSENFVFRDVARCNP